MLNRPVILKQSEIEMVSDIPGLEFRLLPLHLKRRLATYILRLRGDRGSSDIADLLSANNPNVTNFSVIDDVR